MQPCGKQLASNKHIMRTSRLMFSVTTSLTTTCLLTTSSVLVLADGVLNTAHEFTHMKEALQPSVLAFLRGCMRDFFCTFRRSIFCVRIAAKRTVLTRFFRQDWQGHPQIHRAVADSGERTKIADLETRFQAKSEQELQAQVEL